MLFNTFDTLFYKLTENELTNFKKKKHIIEKPMHTKNNIIYFLSCNSNYIVFY